MNDCVVLEMRVADILLAAVEGLHADLSSYKVSRCWAASSPRIPQNCWPLSSDCPSSQSMCSHATLIFTLPKERTTEGWGLSGGGWPPYFTHCVLTQLCLFLESVKKGDLSTCDPSTWIPLTLIRAVCIAVFK